MSNVISIDDNSPVSEMLGMSNGLTSVFINVFGLSGTRLARTEDENMLVVWVLEKNQSAVGIGTVGFNICDMPWELDYFDRQKEFILSVLVGIKERLGWEVLEYQPNEELLFPCVDEFRDLILHVTADKVDIEAGKEWMEISYPAGSNRMFSRCNKHNVLLTCFGCQVCTD